MSFEDYLREVARHFTAKREASLFLSPRDIEVIRGWHALGVPVEVVRNGLDEAFEALQRSKKLKRGPSIGIVSCEPYVMKLWRREDAFVAPETSSADEDDTIHWPQLIQVFLKRCETIAEGKKAWPETLREALTLLLSEGEEALKASIDPEKNGDFARFSQEFSILGDKILRLLWQQRETLPMDDRDQLPKSGPEKDGTDWFLTHRRSLQAVGFPHWSLPTMLAMAS